MQRVLRRSFHATAFRETATNEGNIYYQRVYDSFRHQGFMKHINAKLVHVDKGHCHVELPYSSSVSRQHRDFHGAAIGAIADTAAGYAGWSTLEADNMEVVAVEYKINFLASLTGGKLVAKAKVLKSGKRLIVTVCDVVHVSEGETPKETLCAVLQQTLLAVEKKEQKYV
jgi:uncharacterized protein (TIGR00369 family)